MSIEELYKTFNGLEVKKAGYKGVVCGYRDNYLILAVQEGIEGWLYEDRDITDIIITHQNNPLGYWYFGNNKIVL